MGNLTFRKEERLFKEKNIQELFKKGSSFYLFPFKVLTAPAPPGSATTQVLISVSKKNLKNAVDRNCVKRRIREAYRLNKHLLKDGRRIQIGFIYTHKEKMPSAQVSAKMVHVLNKISAISR
jgi:ribonuclease P protein component